MISLSWESNFEPNSYDADRHIAELMKRYKMLPGHIARKHLKASIRRAIKPGVSILRRNTPPLNTRRGRRKKGEKPQSSGDMRRSVAVRTGYTGRVGAFNHFVWGVLGYKAGIQSRKAIWLQFGTSSGVRPYNMIEKTMAEFGPVSAGRIAKEMRDSLEKAVKDLAPGAESYRGKS